MYLENGQLGKNAWWRYLIGIIFVGAALFAGQIPLLIVLLNAQSKGYDIAGFESNMDFSAIGINPNLGLALLILSFITGLFALFLVIRLVHGKTITSVLTAAKNLRWNRILFSMGLWLLLSIIAEIILFYYDPTRYEFSFNLANFIPLLLVSLFLLPFQTSFEEISLRGYLMQGIGLIGKYRWVAILVTALIFGLGHIMNPEIAKYGFGLMMIYYVGFGILMAVITVMDDGLELALGIHAINNIYASILVTYAGGAIQTDALFKLTDINPVYMLFSWLAIAVMFTMIVSKKYAWQNWGKLLGRIEFKEVG